MIATEAPRRSATHAVPEMQPPAVPKMNTMRIATPLGYSSRPPRKVWPIVLVVGLLLGLGGGAFAVAWFGRKGPEAGTSGSTAPGSAVAVTPVHVDAAVAAPPPVDAGAVAVGARVDAGALAKADAAVAVAGKTATVVIDSTPEGAEVFSADRKPLGKTPARLTLPVSDTAQQFELKLPGYKRKIHSLVVNGNTIVNVELEKAPIVVSPPTGGHKGSGNHHSGADDLERPE
jgi:hypothetical protein